MTPAGLWSGFSTAIARQVQAGDQVIALAHFPESFERMVTSLDEKQVQVQIGDEPLDVDGLRRLLLSPQPQAAIATMVPMLRTTDVHHAPSRDDQPPIDRRVTFVVCERHPLYRHDEKLLDFARQLECRVNIGYFISLEDELLSPFMNDWTRSVLKQMGAEDDQIISSHMISRRVQGLQKRYNRSCQKEQPANSQQAWFEANAVR